MGLSETINHQFNALNVNLLEEYPAHAAYAMSCAAEIQTRPHLGPNFECLSLDNSKKRTVTGVYNSSTDVQVADNGNRFIVVNVPRFEDYEYSTVAVNKTNVDVYLRVDSLSVNLRERAVAITFDHSAVMRFYCEELNCVRFFTRFTRTNPNVFNGVGAANTPFGNHHVLLFPGFTYSPVGAQSVGNSHDLIAAVKFYDIGIGKSRKRIRFQIPSLCRYVMVYCNQIVAIGLPGFDVILLPYVVLQLPVSGADDNRAITIDLTSCVEGCDSVTLCFKYGDVNSLI